MEQRDIAQLEAITMELKRPFPPEVISWKPGALTKAAKDWKVGQEITKEAQAQMKAAAMAYGDFRAYMRRLDDVAGGHWEVRYTPWGNDRIIAELTIYGITRCGTGEYSDGVSKDAPEGTAAEAQAFKRAAAMFGLGRYLYDLPTKWVLFDPSHKAFAKEGQAELDQWYASFYARAEAALTAKAKAAPVPVAVAKPAAPAPVAPIKVEVPVTPEPAAKAGVDDAQALVDAAGLTEQAVVTPVAPTAAPEAPASQLASDGEVWANWKGIADAKKWAGQFLGEPEVAEVWVTNFKVFGKMNESNKASVFAAFVDAVNTKAGR